MATFDKFDNSNNPNINKVGVEDSESTWTKKQLDAYAKEKEKIDRRLERELNDYALSLYLARNNLSFKDQQKRQKQLIDYQNKMRKKQEELEAKRAEHLEDELALKRKKQREQERAQEKEWLEGQLERYRETLKDDNLSLKDKIKNLNSMRKLIKENVSDEEKSAKQIEKFNKVMSALSSGMNQVMNTYAKYQSTINTRLQGTTKDFTGIQSSLLTNVGITPYLKTQVMLDNLQKLVEMGIASNLEQRAFLSSVSDKVAQTFDAFDSNLLRIIRLQQQDSTASRMGMEAYLNRFLNNMFSDTSYLNNAFDTVTGNLVEATSQMSTQMGVQFEYIIQKWLGSLSSVGLSNEAVGNISQALGYLATGNVSGLEGSSMQNLMVMAASRAGLSYADMLTRGINLDETNKLLGSMVEYLQQIGASTNKVVKNQYAATFGVSVSDLVAAGNLRAEDIKNIGNNLLSYQGSMSELGTQLSTIGGRLSVAEKLNNLVANSQFSLYSNIAGTPGLAALWAVTDMIQQNTGGINIPSVLGTGPNTTVENLMKLGIMGVGSLGMIGDIINGIGNTANFSSVLDKLGGNLAIGRGIGVPALSSGWGDSESTYIGQTSGSSFYQNTMEKSRQDVQNQITNNASEDSVNMKKDIADVLLAMHNNVADILSVLSNGTINVSVDNYGLTNV